MPGEIDFENVCFGYTPNVWELELLKPDEQGVNVYYCLHCGEKLGYSTAALYPMDSSAGRIKRVRKCAYCEKSLERPPI